ncbi:hypothetical protein [Roseivivax sp. CAU 1761]
MKINLKRLKSKAAEPTPTPAASETSAKPSTGPKTDPKALPWYGLFKDRGYRDSSVPTDPPPDRRSYVAVEEWITGGGWILDQDEALAMGIWLGRVDPMNYVPPAKPAAPAKSTATAAGGAKKPAGGGSSGGTFKRLGKRRKSAEPAAGPAGP